MGACAFGGAAIALLAGFGSPGLDTAEQDLDHPAASMTVAALGGTARIATIRSLAAGSGGTGTITTAAFTLAAKAIAEAPPVPVREPATVVASISPDLPLPEPSNVQITVTNPLDEAPESAEAVSAVELLDECVVLETCVDHYLFALYLRAAKVDTNKVYEWKKVTVRKKKKLVTVKKRFTRLVTEDFTWKDPNAAEKAGMSMMDYVIGGMDPGFKLKLFQTLRAAEKAGLAPGITSGFRDDYRQSIASGLKAASNRSFHGGSLRGGYGHGLAADVVSVKGATKAQRWISTEALWKWIDANETEFGVGRPYLSRDPPHLAPLDGDEYVSRRGAKTQTAQADDKKPVATAAQPESSAARAKAGKVVRTADAAKPARQSATPRPPVASALVHAAARKSDR